MKPGFIGLGKLGLPIASNLLDRGHELIVYNRTASKAEPLIPKGAKLAGSVAELAKECSIVFSIVFDDTAVREICEGANGLLANLAPGSIHVCLSTISPALAASLEAAHEQRGVHYVSAPVFGRPAAAEARELNYAVAGAADAKGRVEALLKDSGGTIWDFGERVQSSIMVKLCGNFLIIAAAEAIRESIAIGRASEVDVEAMWEMFNRALIKSPLYQFYSGHVLQAQAGGGSIFTSAIPAKDLGLLSAQAKEAGVALPLPLFLLEQLHARS